jgi:hypothetical protein
MRPPNRSIVGAAGDDPLGRWLALMAILSLTGTTGKDTRWRLVGLGSAGMLGYLWWRRRSH